MTRLARASLAAAACCAANALVAAPALAQGAAASTECRREVFFTDAAVVSSTRNLQDNATAKPAELCVAWRQHVTVLKKAVAGYQRCTEGAERAAKLGQAQSSLGEFNEALRQRCQGK